MEQSQYKESRIEVIVGCFAALIVAGAGLVLVPEMPLILVSYLSQVANGFLLPIVLGFMLILSNRTDLLGRLTNSKSYNLIAGGTIVVLVILTLVLLVMQLMGSA